MQKFNPEQMLLNCRREFDEFRGVSPTISRSSTFSVKESHLSSEIFAGKKGPFTDEAIMVGDSLYTSGQIAIDPKTGNMVTGGIKEQVEVSRLPKDALVEISVIAIR